MNHTLPVEHPSPKTLRIGIDPDKDLSGVAIWCCRRQKILRLELMTHPQVVLLCQDYAAVAIVYLEAGHEINFIWGLGKGWSPQKCASKGRDVGVNHGVGYSFIQWFKHYHIDWKPVVPDKKLMGFTPDMVRNQLGYAEKNSELISAARLVIGR